MRPSYFLLCSLLVPAAVGCSDSLPTATTVTPPPPVPVHILSGSQPLFAAYRDGFLDDTGQTLVPWKTLTPSTKIDFMASGPFTITLVCMLDSGNKILTWQASHAADADDTTKTVTEPTIQSPCVGAPAPTFAVTGHLAQPGSIHMGDVGNDVINSGAAQMFTLNVPAGTYDVVASSSDPNVKKTLIQRNVMVSAAQDLGSVDAATGSAWTPVTFLVDNAPKAFDPASPTKNTETVDVEVQVVTKNNNGPARVSVAPYDLTNTTLMVTEMSLPSAALATGDTQQATITGSNTVLKLASNGTDTVPTGVKTTRSITKPFALAGVTTAMTGFDLPTLISIPAWTMDSSQRLGVALPALPALDTLTISTTGVNSAGINATYVMEITSSYFAETSLAHPVFDTSITGYMNSWMVDFGKPYQRDIVSEHDAFTKSVFQGHETSKYHQDVTPPTP
jgi:hypothetical protein